MKNVALYMILIIIFFLAFIINWRQIPQKTVLPNGFIIQGHRTVLSADGRTVLSDDAEFLCFNDRFLRILNLSSSSGIFDATTQAKVRELDHPELSGPEGLFEGGRACNGYYTAVIGPGLLHDYGRLPFLPSCSSVNRSSPTLQNRAWLDRPCADR